MGGSQPVAGRSSDLARLIGLAIGVAACAAALVAWRVPAVGAPPGADVRLVATPPGELAVDPSAVVARAQGLRPGARAAGSMTVSNLTGRRLVVRPVVLPDGPALARELRLSFRAGGELVAAGTVAQLRRQRGPGLDLGVREEAEVAVEMWLVPRARRYRGEIADLTLELHAGTEARR